MTDGFIRGYRRPRFSNGKLQEPSHTMVHALGKGVSEIGAQMCFVTQNHDMKGILAVGRHRVKNVTDDWQLRELSLPAKTFRAFTQL